MQKAGFLMTRLIFDLAVTLVMVNLGPSFEVTTVITLSFWTDKVWANSADPDQTAPRAAV